jgi:hypothetical protein
MDDVQTKIKSELLRWVSFVRGIFANVLGDGQI